MAVKTTQLMVCMAMAAAWVSAAEIDLRPHQDAARVLENPHKGWYHHYPDNSLDKYKIRKESDLTGFPGMDHLYIRMAWSYLEPEEGKYDWRFLDGLIDKWTSKGLGISFRITCKETGRQPIQQQFATPKWVMEAGAKGGHYYKRKTTGPDGPWEPVFDDPVFMEKLGNFLEAFGDRYDGNPWLRYVDIGSIGDWGEGHTSSGSGLRYGFAAKKPHVDLHLKHFPETRLVISDDFVHGIPDEGEREKMHRYLLAHGITYRDDSILVDYYVRAYTKTFSVRSPEAFADSLPLGPNVLELQHYKNFKKDGNWTAEPGSTLAKHGGGMSGPDVFRGAIRKLGATYLGYHGHAHEWLEENPCLTRELLNLCGYWYFPVKATLPDTWQPDALAKVAIDWENRGVAPAYHDFELVMRLEAAGQLADVTQPAGNREWMPGAVACATYDFPLPDDLPAGNYVFKIKLRSKATGRDVALGVKADRLDADGFFRVGDVEIR
jgi:hypothetical protein